MGSRARIAACVLGGLALLPAARAGAQDPAPPRDPAPRYDVYVTEAGSVVEEIGPKRVVTREEIEERSARTLDEALDYEPGIYVRTGNEGVPRIDMRGLRTRHVLLLLDGIPFNSTEDGQFDPTLIPTEAIDRVDLHFGNASVLYGDGPIGGVVQIATRNAEPGLHGEAGGDFRSESQNLGRFALLGRRGALDFLAAGSAYGQGSFPLSDSFDPTSTENGDRRDNADRDRMNLLLKGGWTPTETTRVGALFSAVNADFGVPPNVFDQSDPFGQRTRFERVTNTWGVSGQVSAQWDPQGPLDVRSWLYVNALDEKRSRYDDAGYDSKTDPSLQGTFRATNESRTTGGALHGRYDLGRAGKLRLALQGRREDFDTSGSVRDVRLPRRQFGIRDFDESAHQNVFSAGVEYEVSPLPRTGLVLGYDHAFVDKDAGNDDDGPIALAGAYWDPFQRTRLRGSVARKIRFPSLRQLYDVDGGNPDLDAERSWDYEIGVRQLLGERLSLDVTAFWIDADDFIERQGSGTPFENNDQYRFRGVEVVVDARPLDDLDLSASYTLLDSENRSDDTEEDQLANRPQHRVAFESRYRLPYGFAVRGAVAYVADQIVYSRQTPLQQRGTGDYVLFDLRLAKTLLDDHASLYFGIDNVADEDFQTSYGVPGPGRVFYGGFEGRF